MHRDLTALAPCVPPQLEKNHVVPTAWQDEVLARDGVSREVPCSALTDSLEKTLMLGKIEGRRRRGRQRMRWLDGITDSMDMIKSA